MRWAIDATSEKGPTVSVTFSYDVPHLDTNYLDRVGHRTNITYDSPAKYAKPEPEAAEPAIIVEPPDPPS